jgi:hypothetical protein|nr:uncharacterized protein LOC127308854 [Lolium perenne]
MSDAHCPAHADVEVKDVDAGGATKVVEHCMYAGEVRELEHRGHLPEGLVGPELEDDVLGRGRRRRGGLSSRGERKAQGRWRSSRRTPAGGRGLGTGSAATSRARLKPFTSSLADPALLSIKGAPIVRACCWWRPTATGHCGQCGTRIVKTLGPSGRGAAAVEQGGFVLWTMAPGMWYVELAIGCSKVHVGCKGRLVWRHTPWTC